LAYLNLILMSLLRTYSVCVCVCVCVFGSKILRPLSDIESWHGSLTESHIYALNKTVTHIGISGHFGSVSHSVSEVISFPVLKCHPVLAG